MAVRRPERKKPLVKRISLKDTMSILRQILWGYYKLVFRDSKIEKLSKYRMDICTPCDEKGSYLSFIPKCNQCGCVLAAKTRSKEAKCPLNKW